MDELGDNRHATGPAVVVRGGCVRFGAEGPYLHTNDSHQSIGIVPTLTIVSGMLHVDLDEPLPVVSVVAHPDETLTARGISAGISGGVGFVNVRFHLAGHGPLYLNQPAHYEKVRGDLSNVWLTVLSLRQETTP
jgi:hypothetical protein